MIPDRIFSISFDISVIILGKNVTLLQEQVPYIYKKVFRVYILFYLIETGDAVTRGSEVDLTK